MWQVLRDSRIEDDAKVSIRNYMASLIFDPLALDPNSDEGELNMNHAPLDLVHPEYDLYTAKTLTGNEDTNHTEHSQDHIQSSDWSTGVVERGSDE
jgi:hypothetical protein